MFLPRLALVSTFVGAAVAQFEILSPGGPNDWWGACLSTFFLRSPSYNYATKSPNPRILWSGPAILMPPQQLTSSCPWFPFFFCMIHTRSLTARVNNTNPTILAAPEAIVANVPNADCSFSITVQQAVLTPSTGYTLIFADTLDQTKVRHHLFFLSFHSSD
jgi:hypothetical protein